MKKAISLLLVIIMIASLLPAAAFADTDGEQQTAAFDLSSSPLGGILDFLDKYIFGFGSFIGSFFEKITQSTDTVFSLKTLFSRLFERDNAFARFLKSIFPIPSHAVRYDTDRNGVINYVSLGASNVNGYGLRGYLPDEVYETLNDPTSTVADMKELEGKFDISGYKKAPVEAYPYKVQQALAQMTGKEVVLDQLAMSSMRVEEIRIMLDNGYNGDAFSEWRFTAGQNWFDKAAKADGVDGIDGLRKSYQRAVAGADVITLDIGVNNFGVFVINNSMFDYDFDDIINTSIYFDANARKTYQAAKSLVMSMIESDGEESEEESSVIEGFAGALAYAFVGYCMNFDAVVQRIFRLNPDVNLVIVGIQNPIDGIVLDYEGTEIPLGSIYGALIDMANIYTAVISPNSSKYNYAYIGEDGKASLFVDDLMAYNGDPTTLTDSMKDCLDVYDGSLFLSTRIKTAVLGSITQTVMENNEDGLEPEQLQEIIADMFSIFYPVALNAAYDTVAKIFQAGVKVNSLDISALDSIEETQDLIMDYIQNAATYSVQRVLEGTAVTELPEFDLGTQIYVKRIDGTISCNDIISDPVYATIAAMGVRTSIGNSYFSHPNANGHTEIKDAIINALSKDVKGDEAMEQLGASYMVDGMMYVLKLMSKIDISSVLDKLFAA